jgi:ATP-dependent Clp protease protease subunit
MIHQPSLGGFMKDFDRDYWMDAEEAIKYGIVDGIMDKL